MNVDLETLKKEMFDLKTKHYNVCSCDYCHKDIAVDTYERVMFEPKEVEVEFDVLHFDDGKDGKLGKLLNTEHVTKKEMQSSDVTKDIFKFKCPYCGHYQEVSYDDFYKNIVNFDGHKRINIEFDDVESEAARQFRSEHKDCCEKHLGKRWFSSTGGQFKYTIVPTGLGNIIGIECGACKKKADITNSEDW